MTRLLTLTVAGVLLCGSGIGLGYWSRRPAVKSDTTIWSTGPTVTHIESLGQLVVTRVHIADVLIAEDKGYRGSWLIKGDGLISADLARARVVEADPNSRRARILLPQPRVLSARVDHERSRTWSVEKTSWLPWRGDGDAMRDQAMEHAQKLVQHAANSQEHLDHARGRAEKVLEGVYRMVNWELVIEWELVP